MIYDDLDRHIAEAGSIEKAAVPLGMYLAWCVNLQLVGECLHVESERALLRVRYREMRGSDLLVSACGGKSGKPGYNTRSTRGWLLKNSATANAFRS